MRSSWTNWIVVLVVMVMVGPMLWLLTQIETETQVTRLWLPSESEERNRYDRFVDLFGVDDVLLVSWPGCTPDDARLADFRQRLEALDQEKLFGRMITGDKLVRQLTGPPSHFEKDQAVRRLQGVAIGDDGLTTGSVLYLSAKGRDNGTTAVELVRQAAAETPALDAQQVRMGGSAYVYVMVDKATQRSLLLALPAGLVAVLIGWICFRSLRLTCISFVTAGLSAGFSLALLQLCGVKVNGLLVLTPAMVLVLIMSGTVHLLNYYRNALHTMSNRQAVKQALHDGWLPCTLATCTTCVGIGSLMISQILAVRLFGLFTSVSLLLGTGLLLLFLPSLLIIWPPTKAFGPGWKDRDSDQKCDQAPEQRATAIVFDKRYVSRLLRVIGNHKLRCFLVFALLVGFIASGLPRIRTELRLERFFPAGSRVAGELAWLQEHYISRDNLQVVVGIHDDSDESIANQALELRYVQAALARHDKVQSTYSIHNVMQRIPTGHSMREIFRRVLVNEALAANKSELIRDQFFAERDGWRYWKIYLAINANEPLEYELLSDQFRELTAKQLADSGQPPESTEVFVTGICPVFAQAQTQLFSDLSSSFLLAFVLICPIMMLIIRSVSAGLVAMIPNVMPVLVVYASLGWLNVPMEVGTILTASVGLGIAVDDTLHLLEWYKKGKRINSDRQQALSYALSRCGRPMIQTTLICGLGLLVFGLSQFVPVRQFSLVIVSLLLVALLADLLLLPLLILSPIGFVFSRSK
jgi:predicted RND superfamily exporter protein